MKELIDNLKFTWFYTKSSKKKMILYVIGNILEIVLNIVAPLLSAKIIIELTNNNYLRIILVAFVIFLTECVYDLLHGMTQLLASEIDRVTMSNMEIDLGKTVLELENESLDKNSSGVFIQRITGDTAKLSTIFLNFIYYISNILKYIGVLSALFILEKKVFIYELLFLILLYMLEQKRTTIRKQNDKTYRKKNEKISGLVAELVRGTRDIKMLHSEDDFIEIIKENIENVNKEKNNMNKISIKYRVIISHIKDLKNFFLIILLVFLIYFNEIMPAVALVLYNYSNNLGNSYTMVGGLFEVIKDFNLSTERIRELIQSDKFKHEKFGFRHLNRVEGNFEFKNVSFGYNETFILKDLSFKIKANETVAFVGKSGAGKTTIFNLLCKMYNISSGKILIDGVNIEELDKESIRSNITIISQEPYIFNMSIRENFKLIKKTLTDKEMIQACKLACLDEFINELPNKYDTIIGEGGVNLSGGQKQRLAIARALIQKTKIILFDEATSALDNETQDKIVEALNNMKEKYTILIIAHRLSTIINADRILLIEDGKIIANGNHEQLLKNCKQYKKLYEHEIL